MEVFLHKKDIPKNCEKCLFNIKTNDIDLEEYYEFCIIQGKFIYTTNKDKQCPIKPFYKIECKD